MSKVTITITGHRLLTEGQKKKVMPVLEKAIGNILFTIREHEPGASFMALTPLAEGADTLFAHAAQAVGVPLQVLLPFERDRYLQDFSGDDARSEFDVLYNGVSGDHRRTLDSSSGKDVNELYLALGKKIVDDCDYVIAVWNGKPARGKGGTGDIVPYAMEQKKNILHINPDAEQPSINYLHYDHRKYNDELDRIDTAATYQLDKFITEKQAEYDTNATYYNKRYKKLWEACFVLGLAEVLAFSILVSFHVSLTAHFFLALTEFLCILTIIGLLLFGRAKELHGKYVHYRIVGERLRIKKFFAELGFRISHVVVSPIYFAFKEKPEYGILDNTIRLINLSAWSYLPFEEKRKRLDEELITGQYEYHERKKEKFERKNTQYKRVRSLLFLLLLFSIVMHFAHVTNEFFLEHGWQLTSWEFPLFHYKVFEEIILFLSIFIPATIAACEALKYLYEWEKIITLSGAMANYFKEKSKKLARIHTEAELERFLNDVNKDMLIENLDWEKYMHDKNEVPT